MLFGLLKSLELKTVEKQTKKKTQKTLEDMKKIIKEREMKMERREKENVYAYFHCFFSDRYERDEEITKKKKRHQP